MALTLLSIQSHVVYGHVGNSRRRVRVAAARLRSLAAAYRAVLQPRRLFRLARPSLLSRDDRRLRRRPRAIGALERCDGVLSGYLGRAEIGEAALAAVAAARAPIPAPPIAAILSSAMKDEVSMCARRRRLLPAARCRRRRWRPPTPSNSPGCMAARSATRAEAAPAIAALQAAGRRSSSPPR